MPLSKTIVTALLTLAISVTPVFALAADPTGTWQTTSGESRYKVSYCGDGTELCARLTWLRSDARTPENLALLGKHVVRGARATGENQWQGSVTYDGDTYKGKVTMVGADALKLSGCQGIFCKSLSFTRL